MIFRMTGALMAFLLVAALPATAQEQDKWRRLTSAHFEMYSSADEKKSADTLEYFERVRDFFVKASPVRMGSEFPVRIVVFKDPADMRTYSPNPSVVAYYAPGPLRDTIVMKEPSAENYSVAVHEYVHLVVRHGGLRIPLWLNEGWADVYSTLKPVKDGVAVGDLIPRYMPILSSARWFTLQDLQAVNNKSPEYNESSRTGMFYAESWALVHMLYLSPDYKAMFGRFVTGISRGSTLAEAMETAFKKTPVEVLTDLQGYLSRKKLYGTVFLTPLQKNTDTPPESTGVQAYDADLMLADLQFASNHAAAATLAYRQLQADDPKRPEAFAGTGYIAVQAGDKVTARGEFRKAYDLGTQDAQLCMQLATLDREAKAPAELVMQELDRAITLRSDFSEAIFQLAMMKVDARDFEEATSLLGRVGMVGVERMAIFRSALAYSNLQRGNIEAARGHAEAARRAARTTSENEAADRLVQLIEARSKGPAAVLSGEQVVRKEGTAVGLRCAAPGTGAMSKMGIVIDGVQMLLDLPEVAAVEVTRQPGTKTELKCGALPPFHLTVEYAPASVTNVQSAGIIRRIEF